MAHNALDHYFFKVSLLRWASDHEAIACFDKTDPPPKEMDAFPEHRDPGSALASLPLVTAPKLTGWPPSIKQYKSLSLRETVITRRPSACPSKCSFLFNSHCESRNKNTKRKAVCCTWGWARQNTFLNAHGWTMRERQYTCLRSIFPKLV